MRVTLLTGDGDIKSDRLVEQLTELRTGPKETHEGPIRLELNLNDKEEAEKSIEYLTKLIGVVPLKSSTRKYTKKVALDKLEDVEDIIEGIIKGVEEKGNMEEAIEFLRTYDFVFVDYEMLTTIVQPKSELKLEVPDKYKKYQFLIRRSKKAKDPFNDKYDPRLIFATKIFKGKKVDRFTLFKFGKKAKVIKLKWKNTTKSFKKKEKFFTFPQWMSQELRDKFRKEHRKVVNDPEYKPTRFYTEYQAGVQIY